jgi:large subunit ribosomal protein L29
MKASEIKEMTTEELKDKILAERVAYAKTKMAHSISPLENPVVLKANRKDIARMATELRARQLNDNK